MPKAKDTKRLYEYSRREQDLRDTIERLQSRIDNLISDAYILERQYCVLKENFHILANLKIEKLAECITKNPN